MSQKRRSLGRKEKDGVTRDFNEARNTTKLVEGVVSMAWPGSSVGLVLAS